MLAAATSTPIAVYNRHVSLWYTAGICTHHAWSVIQELATRAAGHHQIKRSEVALQTFVAAEATYFRKPSNLWVTVRSANIRFLCRILEAEAKPWRQSITKLRFVNAGTNLKFLGGTVPSHWNALAESWGPGCVLPVRDGHVNCWHWHPPNPLSTLAPRRLQHQRGSKPWVAHLGASGSSRLEWSFSEVDCYSKGGRTGKFILYIKNDLSPKTTLYLCPKARASKEHLNNKQTMQFLRIRHLGYPPSAESCREQNSYCVRLWTMYPFCSKPAWRIQGIQGRGRSNLAMANGWNKPLTLSHCNHTSPCGAMSQCRVPCTQDKGIPQVCPWSPTSGWSAPQEPPVIFVVRSLNTGSSARTLTELRINHSNFEWLIFRSTWSHT